MMNCEGLGVLLSCTAIVAVMDSSSVVMLEFANVVRIVPGLNAAAATYSPTATTSDFNDAMRSTTSSVPVMALA
jgi:hypothetical protein